MVNIDTKSDTAIELTGSSTIKSGEINISNAVTGISGNFTLTIKDRLKITDCEYGITVGKVNVFENAGCTIINVKTAITAKTLELSGKLTIKDTTESAIILSAAAKTLSFTYTSELTITSTNKVRNRCNRYVTICRLIDSQRKSCYIKLCLRFLHQRRRKFLNAAKMLIFVFNKKIRRLHKRKRIFFGFTQA